MVCSIALKNIDEKQHDHHFFNFYRNYFLAFEAVPYYYNNVCITEARIGQNVYRVFEV